MYGFAIIHAQYGPSEEKTEITAVRVGSNLNNNKRLRHKDCGKRVSEHSPAPHRIIAIWSVD